MSQYEAKVKLTMLHAARILHLSHEM
jgi:hypothetical protein